MVENMISLTDMLFVGTESSYFCTFQSYCSSWLASTYHLMMLSEIGCIRLSWIVNKRVVWLAWLLIYWVVNGLYVPVDFGLDSIIFFCFQFCLLEVHVLILFGLFAVKTNCAKNIEVTFRVQIIYFSNIKEAAIPFLLLGRSIHQSTRLI